MELPSTVKDPHSRVAVSTTKRDALRRFWFRLGLGAGALFLAAGLFGEIAEDVINHDAPLGAIDLHVADWLHLHATPGLTSLMLAVTRLGSPFTIMAISLVAGFVMLFRHQYDRLVALLLAVPGGGLLNVIVKLLVHRHRPVFDHPIVALTSYSFPSGHALGATVTYGLLAAIFVWQTRDPLRRSLAFLAAAVFVAVICFSRIYLGAHYLSDVIAGVLEGLVWLGCCLTAVAALRHSQRHEASSP